MAKRFIDTNFYKSPFVRGLEGASKALYSFIICDCTGAGVWMKDLEIASLYIGLQVKPEHWQVFIDSGKAIEVAPGKFFFPDFIDHQYPAGLCENNKAHKNFLEELLKYNVLEQNSEGAWKPLESPLQGSKVMVKETVKETVKEKVTVEKFEKPTIEQVKAEILTKVNDNRFAQMHAEQFVNYYEANGWKVGKNPMKNWKAALNSTWHPGNAYPEWQKKHGGFKAGSISTTKGNW
jgi:hypothetical protein